MDDACQKCGDMANDHNTVLAVYSRLAEVPPGRYTVCVFRHLEQAVIGRNSHKKISKDSTTEKRQSETYIRPAGGLALRLGKVT